MSAIAQVVPQRTQLTLIPDFAVRCDGEPAALAPSLQRLVSFLAFQPAPVRRAYVSGRLWFDVDDRHASASLRSALWRLHPLDMVCTSNTHVWLNPSVKVDLHAVARHAQTVLRSTPSEEELLAAARELIELGDDILLGWYDDWVLVERERFRQIRLHAMDRIGELFISNDRWYDALQVALAATSAEPLRESAHRLLVQVHLMQGNVAEALRQYRHYAEMLRTELGGRPSPAIRDLVAPFMQSALP